MQLRERNCTDVFLHPPRGRNAVANPDLPRDQIASNYFEQGFYFRTTFGEDQRGPDYLLDLDWKRATMPESA
jgi:hypothetical protein